MKTQILRHVWRRCRLPMTYLILLSFSLQLSAQLPVRAEYFFDGNDPGPGNGIKFPSSDTFFPSSDTFFPSSDTFFPSSDTFVPDALAIDVRGLDPGYHTVYVRVQDMEGKWSQTDSTLFQIDAQQGCDDSSIPYAEMTAIKTPGSTTVSFLGRTTNDSLINVLFEWDFNNDGITDQTGANPSYSFPSLDVYPVHLTITNGSCTSTAIRYIDVGKTPGLITYNGNIQPVINVCSDELPVVLAAPVGSQHYWHGSGQTNTTLNVYTTGTYEVSYVDTDGKIRTSDPVFVTVNPAMNITSEVFPAINGLPNGSAGVEVSGGNSTSIQFLWDDPLAQTTPYAVGLDAGIYSVTVIDGVCDRTLNFTVPALSNQTPDITEAEYFFDGLDPGAGNGIPLLIPTGSDISTYGTIDISNLSAGPHTVHVRTRNILPGGHSIWGFPSSDTFVISSPIPSTVVIPEYDIVKAEYFIGVNDPGPGNGIDLPVQSGQNISQALSASVSQLPTGSYEFHVRTKALNGFWSGTETYSYSINPPGNCHPPIVDFNSSSLVSNTNVQFFGQAISIPSNDPIYPAFYWYVDTDPSAQASTITNQVTASYLGANMSHYFTDPGVYEVRLEVKKSATCSNSIVKNLLVQPNGSYSFTPGEIQVLTDEELCGLIGRETIVTSQVGDREGYSIDMTANGNVIATGARNHNESGNLNGAVRVFERQGNNWVQRGSTIYGDLPGDLAYEVSITDDGLFLAIGAPWANNQAGEVRVFTYRYGNWIKVGPSIDGVGGIDHFGHSVKILNHGGSSINDTVLTVAVGAPNNSDQATYGGEVQVFRYENYSWIQVGNDIEGDVNGAWLGTEVDMNSSGTMLFASAPKTATLGQTPGSIRVYQYSNAQWNVFGAPLIGENAHDFFGGAIELSEDSVHLIVGIPENDDNGQDAGKVKVFQWNGSGWSQKGQDLQGENAGDFFGNDVSINLNGTRIAVGAPFSVGSNNQTQAGATYEYFWNGNTWELDCDIIRASKAGDNLGWQVALSSNGTTLATSATHPLDTGYIHIIDKTKCPDEEVELMAPAGSNYLWSTGETTQNILIDQDGDYQVTYTTPYSVRLTTDPVNINVSERIEFTLDISHSTDGMPNGSACVNSISGGDGNSFQIEWYSINTNGNEVFVSDLLCSHSLPTGSYRVVVNDGQCTVDEYFTINDVSTAGMDNYIRRVEFFIDDPAPVAGTGLSFPIPAGAETRTAFNVSLDALVAQYGLSPLTPGNHTLHFRVMEKANGLNVWSALSSVNIYVRDASPSPVYYEEEELLVIEYTLVPTDAPNQGIRLIQNINDPTFDGTLSLDPTVAGMQEGVSYDVFFRPGQRKTPNNSSILWGTSTKLGNVIYQNCSLPMPAIVGLNLTDTIRKCDGNAVQISVSHVVGQTTHWEGPNGFTHTGNSISLTASSTTEGMYTLYAVDDASGCTSLRDTVFLEVLSPTVNVGPIIGNLQPCNVNQAIYSIPEVDGADDYIWTVSGGASFTGNGSNSIVLDLTSCGGQSCGVDIEVDVVTACGTYSSSTVTVTPCNPYSPTLWTGTAHSIAVTSAELEGFVFSNGSGVSHVMERGICIGLNPNPDVSGKIQDMAGFGDGQFNVQATGLMSNTLYYIRAYAILDDNSVVYGNQESFETDCNFAITSVTPVNHNQGIYLASFPSMDRNRNFILQWKTVDETVWRSKSVKNPKLGAQRFNLTPSYDSDLEVKLVEQHSNSTEEGCIYSLNVPCKDMIIQTAEFQPGVCEGDNAILRVGYSGGMGVKSILWSNGATTKFVEAQQGETLTVTVTDAAGCSQTASITASVVNSAVSPTDMTATRSGTIVTASWKAPSLAPGQTLIGYRVNYRLRNTVSWSVTPLTTDTSMLIDMSSLPVGNYQFAAVTRYEENGNATTSNRSCFAVRGWPGSSSKQLNHGSNGIDAFSEINVYPNPASDRLYVKTPIGVQILLMDLQGKVLKEITANSNETVLDVSRFAQSVYLIEVTSEDEVFTEQVVKY